METPTATHEGDWSTHSESTIPKDAEDPDDLLDHDCDDSENSLQDEADHDSDFFDNVQNSLLDEIDRQIQAELDAQMDALLDQQWTAMMQEDSDHEGEEEGYAPYRYFMDGHDNEEEERHTWMTEDASIPGHSPLDDMMANLHLYSTLDHDRRTFRSLTRPRNGHEATVESIQATIHQVLRQHGYAT